MNDHDLSKLVDAWILAVTQGRDEQGRPTEVHDENWWALETVINWKYDNEPDSLWSFILRVHERDSGERVAAYLAAGPVEDLMSQFGESYIERVEDLANKDVRFKQMLCGVWQSMMSDELWVRFQRALAGCC